MNKILDVRVDVHMLDRQEPEIYVLFDSIKFDHLDFKIAGKHERKPDKDRFRAFKDTLNIDNYNLLAIDNDLAVWFYYSESNDHGMYSGDLIVEGEVRHYNGLWASNAEAINMWFPEYNVMEVMATDDPAAFFDGRSDHRLGATVSSVAAKLKSFGWKVGVVKGADGYVNVQPLLPDGTAVRCSTGAEVLKII